MSKLSVVDITDPNKIQEILDEELNDQSDNESDAGSEASEISELGIVPRLFFSTFSMLTFLVPLVSTHIALDIIVHQQYAQDNDVVEITLRAATAGIGIPSLPADSRDDERANSRQFWYS
jgi:hypothetical protein